MKCKILRCWCSIRCKYGILNCSWLDIIAFSCLSKRFKSTPKALPSLWWMGTIFLKSNKKKKRAFSTVRRNEHTVSWKYCQGDGSTKRWNQKGRLSKVSQNAERKKENVLNLCSISTFTVFLTTEHIYFTPEAEPEPAVEQLVCMPYGFHPMFWLHPREHFIVRDAERSEKWRLP